MIFQPIHRRYGYGAARLPVGAPLGSPSLGRDARTPTHHERSFSAIPGMVCVFLALLLSATTRLTPSSSERPLAEALDQPTTIEFVFEPAAIEAEDTLSEAPEPLAAPVARVDPPTTESPNEPTPSVEPAPPAFDLRQLAMGPSRASIAPAAEASRFDVPPTPRARPMQRLPRPARRIQALGIPGPAAQASLDSIDDFETRAENEIGSVSKARPDAATTRELPLATPTGTAQHERREFLANLATSSGSNAPDPRAGPSRPAVATAAPAVAMAQEIRGRVAAQARADGWHEVPLDELPDCSPPGRQDQLKKEILLATHGERICSHPGGRYRFLETRNLNAFLMWSRTNSDVQFQDQPVRDVCDVLSRALRCLKEASMEEHVTR